MVSAVGRPLAAVRRVLAPGARVLVLSEGAETPAELAALLADDGCGDSALTVLEQLGGPAERRLDGTARDWAHPPGDPLNVVAADLRRDRAGALTPGLPDDAYDHDGQLTKREVRAVTLALLGPRRGELLWDVGAGNGSIALEWLRAHPTCRAVAVEPDADPRGADRGQRRRARRAGRAGRARAGRPRRWPACRRRTRSSSAVASPPTACCRGAGRRCPPVGGWSPTRSPSSRRGCSAPARARLGGELTRLSVARAAPRRRVHRLAPGHARDDLERGQADDGALHRRRAGRGGPAHAAGARPDRGVPGLPVRGHATCRRRCWRSARRAPAVDTAHLRWPRSSTEMVAAHEAGPRRGPAGVGGPLGVLRARRADAPPRRRRGALRPVPGRARVRRRGRRAAARADRADGRADRHPHPHLRAGHPDARRRGPGRAGPLRRHAGAAPVGAPHRRGGGGRVGRATGRSARPRWSRSPAGSTRWCCAGRCRRCRTQVRAAGHPDGRGRDRRARAGRRALPGQPPLLGPRGADEGAGPAPGRHDRGAGAGGGAGRRPRGSTVSLAGPGALAAAAARRGAGRRLRRGRRAGRVAAGPRIDAVVDATHPFAVDDDGARRRGLRARPACRCCGCSARAWTPVPGDDWRPVPDLAAPRPSRCRRWAIACSSPPGAPGSRSSRRWTAGSWSARSTRPSRPCPAGCTVLLDRGPFTLDGERALLREHAIDVLVTKNSGGGAPKLAAARERGVPVVMVERPRRCRPSRDRGARPSPRPRDCVE